MISNPMNRLGGANLLKGRFLETPCSMRALMYYEIAQKLNSYIMKRRGVIIKLHDFKPNLEQFRLFEI